MSAVGRHADRVDRTFVDSIGADIFVYYVPRRNEVSSLCDPKSGANQLRSAI